MAKSAGLPWLYANRGQVQVEAMRQLQKKIVLKIWAFGQLSFVTDHFLASDDCFEAVMADATAATIEFDENGRS